MKPKILIWDIETSPAVTYTWGLYSQNIGLSQVAQRPRVLCFAAKYHGQKKVHFRSEYEMPHDDMIIAAWEFLDATDIVIDYNGKSFDVPTMNGEFIKLGLRPPAPYQHIDMYRQVRKNFRFISHKLDNVLTELSLENKVKHSGFELWTRCMDGQAAAWQEMKRYNIGDVLRLEEVYDETRAWISPHPNLSLYTGLEGCPDCGGKDLQKRGFRYTQTAKYQRMQCNDCGRWSTEGKRLDGVGTRGM